MPTFLLLMMTLLLVVATGEPLRAEDKLKFTGAPVLLHAEQGNQSVLGVDFTASAQRSFGKVVVDARAEGCPATNKDASPRPFSLDVGIGGKHNFFRSVHTAFDPQLVDEAERVSHQWGAVDAGLRVRYESDQPFENQNASIGLELGYVNTRPDGWWALIPSIVVDFEDVRMIEQDGEAQGDGYWRLRAAGSLKIPVGQYQPIGWLKPVNLHGDARIFREVGSGPNWVEEDLGRATYLAGGISYGFPDRRFPKAILLRVSTGRIPPETDDQTTLWIGLVL